MKPIDKFEINDSEKNRNLVEYIYELGCKCCPIWEPDRDPYPDMDKKEYSYWGSSTEVHVSFMKRYDDRLINAPFTFEDYISKKEIQDTLNAYKIDIEKFWYLILFAYDFTVGTCVNGRRIKNIPKALVDELMQQIKENIENANFNFTFINKMKLTLKIAGVPNNITIEDPAALAQMSILYRYASRQYEAGKIEVDNIVLEQNSKAEYEIVLIATFYRLLKNFIIDIYPTISGVDKPSIDAYTTVSGSRILLISRLIYLTKLSSNIKYTGYDENNEPCPKFLHTQLSRYKQNELSRTNAFYPWMPGWGM